MESEVIFYIAGKTAANETQLKKSLADINITVSNVCFATDVRKLVKLLTVAVSRSKLIFIIGGLTDFSDNNIIKILSKALSIKLKNSDLPLLEDACVLENSWGANGSFLESGIQSMCVLPDEPKQIDVIMKNQLKTILSKKYKLPIQSRTTPSEDFLKNPDSNLIVDFHSETKNNTQELSLEQIRDILPEDINRELFGKLNQEASYDKSGKISPNINPDIFEDINNSSKNTKQDTEVIEEQNNNIKNKNMAVFEDPDIELENVDLEAENYTREKIKLNNQAQDIISSQNNISENTKKAEPIENNNFNNFEDEELLVQSIKKSKSSMLIDTLLVMLILTSIGCAVYIYYKVFLG